MFTKIALAAALTIGTACAALAAPDTDPTGGFREEGAGGFVTDGVNPVFHPSLRGAAGKAYGYAPGSASCAERFKSYDAATGTYLGANGVRKTCS